MDKCSSPLQPSSFTRSCRISLLAGFKWRFVALEALADEEYWVKKDDDSFRRIPGSKIVGTVDLTVHWFLIGETYPGEVKRDDNSRIAYDDGRLYAYIANLCVNRLERRGVATNMLYFAMDTALRAGIKQFYIHVNAANIPAQKLCQKIGFEIVEVASPPMAMMSMKF